MVNRTYFTTRLSNTLLRAQRECSTRSRKLDRWTDTAFLITSFILFCGVDASGYYSTQPERCGEASRESSSWSSRPIFLTRNAFQVFLASVCHDPISISSTDCCSLLIAHSHLKRSLSSRVLPHCCAGPCVRDHRAATLRMTAQLSKQTRVWTQTTTSYRGRLETWC